MKRINVLLSLDLSVNHILGLQLFHFSDQRPPLTKKCTQSALAGLKLLNSYPEKLNLYKKKQDLFFHKMCSKTVIGYTILNRDFITIKRAQIQLNTKVHA